MDLKSIRLTRGLEQRQVAESIGVTASTYSRYESGEREPDIPTLIRIADYFGLSLDEVVGRSNIPSVPIWIGNAQKRAPFTASQMQFLSEMKYEILHAIASIQK